MKRAKLVLERAKNQRANLRYKRTLEALQLWLWESG